MRKARLRLYFERFNSPFQKSRRNFNITDPCCQMYKGRCRIQNELLGKKTRWNSYQLSKQSLTEQGNSVDNNASAHLT